jgi:cation diffusion facilitator family transporter
MTEAVDVITNDKMKTKATYVGAGINVIQTLLKISFGILGHSASLLADGLHSLSDLLSDFLVIVAVKLGSRKADHDHQYGHKRYETIATGILGISLFALGVGVAWHVMERLQNPEHLPVPDPMTLGIAVLSILINEWLFHYTRRVAIKTRSKLLLANAWHQRSDALTSIVVLLGVGAVMLGYPFADAIAAIVVALMLIKMGVSMTIESVKELIDTALSPELLADIANATKNINGVEDIHLLRTRKMGEDAYVDAHIVVDPRISVSEGHMISDIVRDTLVKHFDDVLDVLVHVDSEDDQSPGHKCTELTRVDVQCLLHKYLGSNKSTLEEFRIHYLDGQIEIELFFPLSLVEQNQALDSIKSQCKQLVENAPAISKTVLFFKLKED